MSKEQKRIIPEFTEPPAQKKAVAEVERQEVARRIERTSDKWETKFDLLDYIQAQANLEIRHRVVVATGDISNQAAIAVMRLCKEHNYDFRREE